MSGETITLRTHMIYTVCACAVGIGRKNQGGIEEKQVTAVGGKYACTHAHTLLSRRSFPARRRRHGPNESISRRGTISLLLHMSRSTRAARNGHTRTLTSSVP